MNFLAALIFFTRLPFWRLKEVPSESFKHIVPYWPWVGWLTGGAIAITLWLGQHVLPISAAWILAIAVRLLITGALHEDGLADFFDGIGGGRSREHRLEIMKDSHIGTYGVLGLTIYFLLFTQMSRIPIEQLCTLVVCGDCWAKCCASQLINFLPYARVEQASKAKVVYNEMSLKEFIVALIGGITPAIILLQWELWMAMAAAVVMLILLIQIMKRHINGYTGDCCGATFLLCELTFHLTSMITILQLWR